MSCRGLHVFLVDDTEPNQHHAIEQVDGCTERNEEGQDYALGRVV